MNKLKYLVLLLALVLVLPFAVYAEGEEGEGEPVVTSEDGGTDDGSVEVDQRAIVYFFRGEGCSHCAEAEAWFESIQEEYGSKFVIKDYETWYDTDNASLMAQVAEARNEDAGGVPYILIGDQSWVGFSEATMGDEIKAKIDQLYEQPVNERYDALALVGVDSNAGDSEEEEKSNDVVGLFIIIIVAGALGFGIYKARQSAN